MTTYKQCHAGLFDARQTSTPLRARARVCSHPRTHHACGMLALLQAHPSVSCVCVWVCVPRQTDSIEMSIPVHAPQTGATWAPVLDQMLRRSPNTKRFLDESTHLELMHSRQ